MHAGSAGANDLRGLDVLSGGRTKDTYVNGFEPAYHGIGHIVHSVLALHAVDQLRQRAAHALIQTFVLSQIGVSHNWYAASARSRGQQPRLCTPHSCTCSPRGHQLERLARRNTEIWITYYGSSAIRTWDRPSLLILSTLLLISNRAWSDILLRHAFGCTRDILMEISYSGLMASYASSLPPPLPHHTPSHRYASYASPSTTSPPHTFSQVPHLPRLELLRRLGSHARRVCHVCQVW